MCGIAGVLTTSFHSATESHIYKMKANLEHRGPDDFGLYVSEDKNIGLVHTRLSILDLSQNGHQPMSINDQRYWITFNGEIYNFLQLRQQLQKSGETFVSMTDTEVILKLYARHGIECLKFLRGMFAFAIWDNLEKICFIARDSMGVKPIYFYQNPRDRTFIFASEIRAILATEIVPKQLSAFGLYTYFSNGSVSEPWTIIEDIKCLEAGHYLIWKSGEVKQQKYWQLDFQPALNDQDLGGSKSGFISDSSEAIAKARTALIDTVKHHFVSDVPVGIFLSGGIDSTAIVAIARHLQMDNLCTYSIAFNESQWNEGTIARQVANDFGTNHTEYILTADSAQSLLPEYWRSLDQPTIDGFNTFCVSKVAHQHHMKVVLSGLGGDELFGGYSTFQTVPKIWQQRQQLAYLESIFHLFGKPLEKLCRSSKIRRIGAFLSQKNSIVNAYGLARGVFSNWEALQLVNFYLGGTVGDRLGSEINNFKNLHSCDLSTFPTPEDQVSYLELSRYMRNQLLRDSDVMSMRWGLELRVPFVDQTLFQEVRAIAASIRLQRNKGLLVSAIPEIPNYVTRLKKRGFTVPFEQWINREWHMDKHLSQQIPSHIPLPSGQWYRHWSLIVLQNWLDNI